MRFRGMATPAARGFSRAAGVLSGLFVSGSFRLAADDAQPDVVSSAHHGTDNEHPLVRFQLVSVACETPAGWHLTHASHHRMAGCDISWWNLGFRCERRSALASRYIRS